VYLREAHPIDGWVKPNSQIKDPTSQAERDLAARQCGQELAFEFSVLVDTMDDQTAVDWAAWPERIFVVGVDGRVAYAGQQGPWGFWPTEQVRREAAQKNADRVKKADNVTKEGKRKQADLLQRNYDGESLEKFLAGMLPSKQPPDAKAAPGRGAGRSIEKGAAPRNAGPAGH
jgi:hypothetical protein